MVRQIFLFAYLNSLTYEPIATLSIPHKFQLATFKRLTLLDIVLPAKEKFPDWLNVAYERQAVACTSSANGRYLPYGKW